MSGTLTVDYFLIRQWRQLLQQVGPVTNSPDVLLRFTTYEPVKEGLYEFYVKDNFKIKTRRNYFPLEIELFKDDVLILSSAMPTIGVWTKKTKNIPGLAKTMRNCPSTTSNILP
jgi:hypothetical protein